MVLVQLSDRTASRALQIAEASKISIQDLFEQLLNKREGQSAPVSVAPAAKGEASSLAKELYELAYFKEKPDGRKYTTEQLHKAHRPAEEWDSKGSGARKNGGRLFAQLSRKPPPGSKVEVVRVGTTPQNQAIYQTRTIREA